MMNNGYTRFKINQSLKRGFTLIELLVVIAIIGILASVVLASLNTARAKGADAALKGALSQVRAQGELFFDVPRSYDTICTADPAFVKISANALTNSVAGATLVNADATAGSANTVICHDSATAFAISAPLKGVSGSYFCADSTGVAKVVASTLAASIYVCP